MPPISNTLEHSPIRFFLLSRHTPSPYKTQVQTQEIVQKAQINARKMLGLILLLLLLLGGSEGKGNYSASTQPKNIFAWMDLGPAFQLTEASGQPCFASVGQAIKNTQTDTEQTYRETKACPKTRAADHASGWLDFAATPPPRSVAAGGATRAAGRLQASSGQGKAGGQAGSARLNRPHRSRDGHKGAFTAPGKLPQPLLMFFAASRDSAPQPCR